MFSDTVMENIKMGNEHARKQDVIEAAKAAQYHDFIMSLPDGYDTIIGGEGMYLSGGEQQRIALARAILKDAPIIVLDEATAYADSENEIKIQKAFSEMIKDKTVIVIAHRLYTITDADQILVVVDGKIKEKGKHRELLEQGRIYNKMWDAHISAGEWVLQEDYFLGNKGGIAL
jgi:ATP-binding cassette subfamily B protein